MSNGLQLKPVPWFREETGLKPSGHVRAKRKTKIQHHPLTVVNERETLFVRVYRIGWTPVSHGALGVKLNKLFAVAAALVAFQSVPARAQWFDDEGGWSIFSFHRYGGDVNRPGSSPDRPYWHGDDAVPLGLRWRDLEEAKAEAAAADSAAAAAAAAISVSVHPHRTTRRHKVVHRRAAPQMAAKDCVPTVVVVPKP